MAFRLVRYCILRARVHHNEKLTDGNGHHLYLVLAGIARSWASYFDLFLQHWGIHIPHWMVTTELLGMSCSLLASLLVLACTFILLAGVHVRKAHCVHNCISSY